MATWTNIADEFLEPGKPVRSVDGLALRDNPIAIAEGASGAPRIEDPALGQTATSDGRDWVLARVALAKVGSVGTYAMLRNNYSTSFDEGYTTAGSNLIYASAAGEVGNTVASPSGTWRAMGYCSIGTIADRTTLWLRIS
jgi:hypothetical protein